MPGLMWSPPVVMMAWRCSFFWDSFLYVFARFSGSPTLWVEFSFFWCVRTIKLVPDPPVLLRGWFSPCKRFCPPPFGLGLLRSYPSSLAPEIESNFFSCLSLLTSTSEFRLCNTCLAWTLLRLPFLVSRPPGSRLCCVVCGSAGLVPKPLWIFIFTPRFYALTWV